MTCSSLTRRTHTGPPAHRGYRPVCGGLGWMERFDAEEALERPPIRKPSAGSKAPLKPFHAYGGGALRGPEPSLDLPTHNVFASATARQQRHRPPHDPPSQPHPAYHHRPPLEKRPRPVAAQTTTEAAPQGVPLPPLRPGTDGSRRLSPRTDDYDDEDQNSDELFDGAEGAGEQQRQQQHRSAADVGRDSCQPRQQRPPPRSDLARSAPRRSDGTPRTASFGRHRSQVATDWPAVSRRQWCVCQT